MKAMSLHGTDDAMATQTRFFTVLQNLLDNDERFATLATGLQPTKPNFAVLPAKDAKERCQVSAAWSSGGVQWIVARPSLTTAMRPPSRLAVVAARAAPVV